MAIWPCRFSIIEWTKKANVEPGIKQHIGAPGRSTPADVACTSLMIASTVKKPLSVIRLTL